MTETSPLIFKSGELDVNHLVADTDDFRREFSNLKKNNGIKSMESEEATNYPRTGSHSSLSGMIPSSIDEFVGMGKGIWRYVLVTIAGLLVTTGTILLIVSGSSSSSSPHHSHGTHGLSSNAGRISPHLHIRSDEEKTAYTREAINDLIDQLPTLDEEVPFRHFSGYLDIGNEENEKKLFYWFVESQYQPHNDPLVLWTGGGPGCSGLSALLTEHGPYLVNDEYHLEMNPNAWNMRANVLYLEQPYGVGFSEASSVDDIVSGDENAAMDMDMALRAFLRKFPKFADHDVLLASESWGGHYLPITARTIMENNALKYSPTLNLKGFIVGNPYTDTYENVYGMIKSLYGHGLMREELMMGWETLCTNAEIMSKNKDFCDQLVNQVYDTVRHVDLYSLDYPKCYHNDRTRMQPFHQRVMQERLQRLAKSERLPEQRRREWRMRAESLLNQKTYVTCGEGVLGEYLNQAKVQKELHVKKKWVYAWQMCSRAVYSAWPWSDFEAPMQEHYDALVKDYDLTIFVFSGTDDAICGSLGTQFWMNGMGWSQDYAHNWEKWSTEDGMISGFYTKYLNKEHTKVAAHFYTVHSAGHSIAGSQPERALTIFNRFMDEATK